MRKKIQKTWSYLLMSVLKTNIKSFKRHTILDSKAGFNLFLMKKTKI